MLLADDAGDLPNDVVNVQVKRRDVPPFRQRTEDAVLACSEGITYAKPLRVGTVILGVSRPLAAGDGRRRYTAGASAVNRLQIRLSHAEHPVKYQTEPRP